MSGFISCPLDLAFSRAMRDANQRALNSGSSGGPVEASRTNKHVRVLLNVRDSLPVRPGLVRGNEDTVRYAGKLIVFSPQAPLKRPT